jgi:hypothetical protein
MTDLRGAMAGLAAAAMLALVAAPAAQAAPTAAAKDIPAPSVSGVTVTAPQKPDPLVDRTTRFVRERLPTSRFEQYARFRDPVCIKVIGLPDQFDAFIAKRIADVARQVNAPVDPKPGCTPNVNVVFSPRPQAQLDDISKRRDILFGFHFQAEMKKLTTFSRPIQAWYVTRIEDTQGNKILELNDPAPCITSNPLAPPCDVKAPAVMGRAGSRLGNDMSSELLHSLIIADANKVAGEKIDAVADYIAVLALSRWQGLERCSGMPTILNLLADGCDAQDRPEGATPADLALLEGLYSANVRETGAQQRATIASAIRKSAETGSPPRR